MRDGYAERTVRVPRHQDPTLDAPADEEDVLLAAEEEHAAKEAEAEYHEWTPHSAVREDDER